MAQTLPPALLAAQDAKVRQPCIELKASSFDESIPFIGRRLDEYAGTEKGLSVILHSSGRIYAAYVLEEDRIVQLAYTDAERTQFTYVDIGSNLYGLECTLLELADQNIALIVTLSGRAPNAYILNQAGEVLHKTQMPNAFKDAYGLAMLRRSTDYLLMFSQPATTVKPAVSGSGYEGAETKQYTLTVVGDGTNAEAGFRYSPSGLAVPMGNGKPVEMEKGLTVTWPSTLYTDGQEYFFTAYPASPSEGKCVIKSIPADGANVSIAGTMYTFVDVLDPQTPYQVQIDHMSSEISAENLRCAINADEYEGSGAGFRYSSAAANPHITAERRSGAAELALRARTAGKDTYPAASSDAGIVVSAISGGTDPSVSAVTALDSCKTANAATLDFKKFTAPADMPLPGVVASRNKKQYAFCKLPDGRVVLTFDCITGGSTAATAITNIFYAVSTDGGHNFGRAQAVTGYSAPREIANTARIAVKDEKSAVLTYGESVGCLWLNQGGGSVFHVDLVRRRAYISSNGAGQGGAVPVLLYEADIDEWKILRTWGTSSHPALPSWMSGEPLGAGTVYPSWAKSKSDGRYVCLGTAGGRGFGEIRLAAVMVLDVTKNLFKSLFFEKYTKSNDNNYVFHKNVDLSNSKIKGECYAQLYRIHADENRMWVVLGDSGDEKRKELAYFDLDEIFDQSNSRYTANVVYDLTGEKIPSRIEAEYNDEDNVWAVNLGYCIKVLDAESYALLHIVDAGTISNFPANGLMQIKYKSGKIYGAADNTENEAKYSGIQGLCIIELAQNSISYHKPGTAFAGNYSNYIFRSPQPISGNRVLGVAGNHTLAADRFWSSLALFDEDTQTWTFLNSGNTRGFHDLYVDSHFAYDETTGLIYTMAAVNKVNSWSTIGFQLVSIEGAIDRVYYRGVNIDGDNLYFSEPKTLVKGNAETNGVPLADPSDRGLYYFWRHRYGEHQRICYDKEVMPLDLSRYLLRGSTVTISKTVDVTPNTLNFSVANGHLFDTTNTASTLNRYFQKGKKIEIKIGEKINGVEKYPDLPDVFVVTKTSMTYKRGQYPVLTVECADRRYLFEQIQIVASEYYTAAAPHDVIVSVLKKHCAVGEKNIRVPAVDEPGAYITGQFIEQNALQSLNEIAERFGYFLYADVGDIITMKKIDTAMPISHSYAGAAWMVNYTPDDSFADFTNKITVVGESPEKIAVHMPEELALTDSGTMGWWKRRKTKRLYYSEDEQKIYTNPRLVVVEAASSIGFKLAGRVKEYLSSQATANTYVDVTIETPNILPVFLSALAMIAAAKSMPPVIVPPDPQTGYGGGTAQSHEAGILESMGTWLALQCLGAVANYQYEIYAQPIGYIRRSFQYSVTDDEIIKQLNNTVIEKKINNPYCYTQQHCEKVANFEMMVAKAQRSRIKLTKIMHLKDEVGDTIQIKHPYNSLKQRIFITDMMREIQIPESGGEGRCIDHIEGWKL